VSFFSRSVKLSMETELVLGVDLGTTALKAGLFDLTGELVAVAEAAYPIDRPAPDAAEQAPEAWTAAFETVLDRLAAAVPRRRAAAVGICSQVNTHVFVDAAIRPLRPAILWQDQRADAVAAELNATFSERAPAKAAHVSFPASSHVARAEWLSRNEPAVWESTRFVLSPKDYLTASLCAVSRPATDPITPFDLVGESGAYDPDILELVPGLAERLPVIDRLDAPVGVVSSRDLPLIGDATVVVGTMDAWGNVYGSGVVDHGDAMEVAGTSEIIAVLSRESHPTPGVVSFLPVDGHRLHAGPTQAGGAALAWFADTTRRPIAEAIVAAENAPPGSGGVIFLPHLLGERAPLWDGDLRGGFLGLSSDTTYAELVRALLEGVAFSARHLLEEIDRAAGFEAAALVASGGGSQSDLWCQIKADVFGRPIARSTVRHTGCLGAALMAASGARLVSDLRTAASDAVRIDRVFEPRSERALYDELYAVYRGVQQALAPTHAALAGFRSHLDVVPAS
jgi:xylulokinase